MHDHHIAIVAMDGLFPGASTVDEFWAATLAGVEAGTPFSIEELVAAGVPRALAQRPDYVRRRPLLERCDAFDAAFFGFNALEAEALDPQMRLLLQCAYRALEACGHVDDVSRQRTGSFVGIRQSRYLEEHLMRSPRHCDALGTGYLQMINRKDSAATLLAYKLDLRGPAISVNTACSTSLLAVHLACASLLSHECDVALAGGAAVPAFGPDGHLYVPGGFLSQDGRCRPFSDDAGGTIDGAGVALVALKRYDDAVRDGNSIHAVILGSAANNDGADKAGYTAPSVSGQERVIADALAFADVSPDSIGFVETHGTGTRLGDPIEVRALTQAYRRHTSRTGYCHLGSVKANLGHLGAAAGVVGLIKAALAVRDARIPRLVNFTRPNPELSLDTSPFLIPRDTCDWPTPDGPRRAAVSSFGIGGTNVHAIVEEPLRTPPRAPRSMAHPALCLLSARSAASLAQGLRQVAAHLGTAPATDLHDLAATLATSRAHLPWRAFAVVDDVGRLAASWQQAGVPSAPSGTRPRIAFLFPGQGSQHRGMTLALRARWPAFAAAFDEAAAGVRRHGGFDLAELLSDPDETRITQTAFAQPALFATSYALCTAWRALGVEPQAMLGHSVGELVAACAAGVFSLDDGLRLVCARGRLMQAAASGRMLAVALDAATLQTRLPADIEIAAINGCASCVVAGPPQAIEGLQARFEAQGIGTRPLRTSHAFHSASMEGAARELAAVARTLDFAAPSCRVVSNVTGEPLAESDARSPDYWARQLRAPVQFERGLHCLAGMRIDAVLEVGAGTVLTSFARAELPQLTAIASQPHAGGDHGSAHAAETAYLRAAGALWSLGVPVDLDAVVPRAEGFRRVSLPGYAFEPVRHWVEAGSGSAVTDGPAPDAGVRRMVLVPFVPAATDAPGTSAARRIFAPTAWPLLEAAGAHSGLHHVIEASDCDAAVIHGRDALVTCALHVAAGRTAKPLAVADFRHPANIDALAALLDAPLPAHPVVFLEGRAFRLAAEPVAAAPGPGIMLKHLLGQPGTWRAPLEAQLGATEDAQPVNIWWLAGEAGTETPDLDTLPDVSGPWLLIDQADLPPAERAAREDGVRTALRARGVRHAAWLALAGTSRSDDGAAALARAIQAIGVPDAAIYLEMLPTAEAAGTLSDNDTGSSPMTTDPSETEQSTHGPGDVPGTIRAIWSQVLGVEHIEPNDNFFDLGGNSLWALQIVSRVNEAFGCNLHLAELLDAATVNDLTALVEKRLLSGVDESELNALLGELGELPEEELQRMLLQVD